MVKKSPKRAFITGITGQDGSYLAEFLLKKDYQVAGLIRRNACNEIGNIKHLKGQLTLYHGDMTSPDSIAQALADFKPDEIYNLASQSSPLLSFKDRLGTMLIAGLGAFHVFDKARQIVPRARIYQASTSEMFGVPKEIPQNENTPLRPANPYATAKEYAHRMAYLARQDRNYPQFISCGILFNHESPRRGLQFVTRKVSVAVACIKNKRSNGIIPLNELGNPIVQKGKLRVGDLKAKRDWGYAPDFIEAMWLILQHDKPDDFVIATGETHTVEELCKEAFAVVGLDWKKYTVSDKNFVPPIQTGPLCGDATKANKILGWKPKTTFKELIKIMVKEDIKLYS